MQPQTTLDELEALDALDALEVLDSLETLDIHLNPPPSEGPGEAPPSSLIPHPSSNSPSFGGVRGGFNPPLQGEGWGEALPLLRRGQGRLQYSLSTRASSSPSVNTSSSIGRFVSAVSRRTMPSCMSIILEAFK